MRRRGQHKGRISLDDIEGGEKKLAGFLAQVPTTGLLGLSPKK